MMRCAFIEKDNSIEYKDLNENEVNELCSDNKYFSINLNNENMVFVDKVLYVPESIDNTMSLVVRANKELMFK